MRFAFDQVALPGSCFEEQLRHALNAQADGIQLCWLRSAEAHQFNDRAGAQAMLGAAQGAGLTITGLTLHCLSDETSLLGDAAERTEACEIVARGLAFATLIKAPLVVLPFIGRSRIETDEEMSRAAEALSTVCEVAARLGVRLAIRGGTNANRIHRLLGCTDHEDILAVCLDVADVAVKGIEAGTIIRTLGNRRLAMIWARDVLRQPGQLPDFRVRLGRGIVDFESIRHALMAVEFDGWIVVDTLPGDPAGQIAELNMADARQLLSGPSGRVATTA